MLKENGHIQETFEGKGARSQRSTGQGKSCCQEDARVALTAISKDILLKSVGL